MPVNIRHDILPILAGAEAAAVSDDSPLCCQHQMNASRTWPIKIFCGLYRSG